MVYGNGYHPNALVTNIGVVLKKLGLKPKRTMRFVAWYGFEDRGLIKAEEMKNVEFQIALWRDKIISKSNMNQEGNVIGVNFGGSLEAGCVLHEIVQ